MDRDCEKVRDRFSSLREGESSPSEEKVLRDHLFSCPTCQREFEQFEKTMGWLHSAGEVEVPEGFLPELHQKLEEKKRAVPREKLGEKWFHLPISFKLPIQAGAMVVVVFLVLYLTKTIPMEGVRPKEAKQVPSPLSLPDKSEKALGQRAVEGDRRQLEAPAETPRLKDMDQEKAPVPEGGLSEEASASRGMAKAKKREAPARSAEVLGYQAAASKQAARADVPSPQTGKIEKELAGQEESYVASKPPRQIILRTSDRKKAIFRLNELVKQLGGEVVTTKEDIFLASVPTSSFSEFEKELAEFSSSDKSDLLIVKKQAPESLRVEQEAKKEEGAEKSKGSARLAADAESRTMVRILVVEE